MKIKYNFFSVNIILLCLFYILSFTSFGIAEISQYLKFIMLFSSSILFYLYSHKMVVLKKNDILLFLVVSIYYGGLLVISANSIEDILNWIIVVICYLNNIIFVFSNLNFKKFSEILNIIYNTLLIGLVFPSFLLSFNSNYYYLQAERYRFTSFMNNPNELAQFICVVILISIFKLYEKHSLSKKFYYLMISFISIYIVFRTGSRASIIMIGSFLLFFLVGKFFGTYKIKKELSYIISLLIFLSVIFLNYFLNRNIMLLEKLDTLSSNRLSIWREILKFDDLNTFFFGGKIIKSFGDMVITNAFIEIFGIMGIIGLILWLVILNSRIQNSSNNKLVLLFQFSVLFSYLIYYQFESGINGLANISSFFFWLIISFNDVEKLSEIERYN